MAGGYMVRREVALGMVLAKRRKSSSRSGNSGKSNQNADLPLPAQVNLPGGGQINLAKYGGILGVIVAVAVVVLLLLSNTIFGSSAQMWAQYFLWSVELNNADVIAAGFLPQEQDSVRQQINSGGMKFLNKLRASNFTQKETDVEDDAAYIKITVAPDLLGDQSQQPNLVEVMLPMVRDGNTWYITTDAQAVDARMQDTEEPAAQQVAQSTPAVEPAPASQPRSTPTPTVQRAATPRPSGARTPTPVPVAGQLGQNSGAETVSVPPGATANTLIHTFQDGQGNQIKLLYGKGTGHKGDWGWAHIVDKHIHGHWLDGGIVTTYPKAIGTTSEGEVIGLIAQTLQQKPAVDHGRYLYRMPVQGTKFRILVVVGNDHETIITAYPEQ